MPGWEGRSASFSDAYKASVAARGIVGVFVNVRGATPSAGSHDASAREIHDLIDALNEVKSVWGAKVDAEQAYIVGYSGGGGNVFGAIAKFPDSFNGAISFYGISDYGHDSTDSWYATTAGYRASIETRIGGTPIEVPDAYHARAHVLGIINYSGHLWLFHDAEDTTVPPINTMNVIDALDAAEMTNYVADISTPGSADRWLHDGYPELAAEPSYMPAIAAKTHLAWTIPAAGTVTVLGYIVTKRFSIWLGGLAEAAAGAGLDEVATVAYDTSTGEYAVTPLTGEMDVFIKQDALTASQHITEATVLTVA